MSRHRGSNFDDFLREEGMLDAAEAEAAKRIFVFPPEQEMKRKRVTKEKLAEKLDTKGWNT